ncbi:MAG TPA: tRNA uridine-5-carboxymethylaminomethyl(34) synthesis GTPase MnmE [Bacteroidales bacterium]
MGIIRISGPEAFGICNKIIRNKDLTQQASHTIHFCKIYDGPEIIDEALLSIFKGPNSYTGEDTIEISCHGSPYILQKIVLLLIKHGAQMAQPGEYTLRAFMNGKLDLTQAEAVADLIMASSKAAHDTAIDQMKGGFSKKLAGLRDNLLQFASMIELELDFSEEDVEFANREQLRNQVTEIAALVQGLIKSFEYGNAIKNGIPVAIVGKPNVGKSTLLNALLNEEKAIVSDIPGTTRDAIEDTLNIDGIIFRIIDTAGIRHTQDTVENMGIERTFDNIRKASIVLILVDATDEPEEIEKQIKSTSHEGGKDVILVVNKIDKLEKSILDKKLEALSQHLSYPVIALSAKKNINIERIVDTLKKVINSKAPVDNSVIITNIRHAEALQNTFEASQRVLEGLASHLTTDLVAQDIREMIYHLGTITGEITTDEILGNIFKNFCIGK